MIRRIDPTLAHQYQTASILASLMVRANVADAELAELNAIEVTKERRKDILSLVVPFMSFALLAWPLILRGKI